MSDYAESVLSSIETFINDLTPERLAEQPGSRVMRAARSELGKCGMSPSYRDLFVARMPISIGGPVTEEQTERLEQAARTLVRNLYTYLSNEGYTDQVIAEMAAQASLRFEA